MDAKIDHNLVEKPKPQKHAPFFTLLQKKQETTCYTSYTGDEESYPFKADEVLKKLQYYMISSNEDAYNELVARFPDRFFRRTKGQVYEMFDEGNKIQIDIALQVKAHSLTWYFWAPDKMDQYPQEFRDVLYNSAAIAHKSVTNGCDLYYRGSNSVHVKLMHHLESESGHNHNHYRLKNNQPYTPADFKEHMEALKSTEAFEQFFEPDEIEELIKEFTSFYTEWHTKPEDGLSKHEEYMNEISQQLNTGDVIELMLFGHQQEPCRINVSELKVDYESARQEIEDALGKVDDDEAETRLKQKLIEIKGQYDNLLKYREKGGSRGLFSEIASTRQTYQSELKPISYVGGQDSSFGAPPAIPEWAKKLTALVEEGQKAMLESRAKEDVIGQSQTTEAIQRFDQEIPERVRIANMSKNMFFKSVEKKDNVEEQPTQSNTTGLG